MQKLFQYLAYLFEKLEIEFANFEWDLSYSMVCLDLLDTALLQPHDLVSRHKRLTGKGLVNFGLLLIVEPQL